MSKELICEECRNSTDELFLLDDISVCDDCFNNAIGEENEEEEN